eukprot:maker-scaffold71_size417697-snap-gene-0.14 protein:Tk11793 transcript:maker-scaffold71_size417697-snap-gene-0.14-mRNA-1 annotation:"hypothetical protein PTSG_06373"
MRFSLNSVPSCLLLCFPFYVAYNGWGLIATTFFMVLWLGIRQGITLRRVKPGSTDNRLVLHSITLSHYVDKIRWSLEHLGVDFEEEEDVGILGVMLFGRWVPALHDVATGNVISNSADILRFMYGKFFNDSKSEKYLKPTQEAIDLEKKLDRLGLDLRRYMYYHLLVLSPKPNEVSMKVWGLYSPHIPQWQKYILKAVMPILRKLLINKANITPDGAADGWKQSQVTFKEMDALLSDGRKYLLETDYPTFVDVTYATLAALLALPDNYGGQRVTPESRPDMSDLSAEYQKQIKAFRLTASGKFILRMYKDREMGQI